MRLEGYHRAYRLDSLEIAAEKRHTHLSHPVILLDGEAAVLV